MRSAAERCLVFGWNLKLDRFRWNFNMSCKMILKKCCRKKKSKKCQILVIFGHFRSYYRNFGWVWGVKFQKLYKIPNMVLKLKLLMRSFQKNQNRVIWGHVTSFKGHFWLIFGHFLLKMAISWPPTLPHIFFYFFRKI